MQGFYMLAIFSAIGAAIFWFYNLLVRKKEVEEAEHQARIEAKRARKAARKEKSH